MTCVPDFAVRICENQSPCDRSFKRLAIAQKFPLYGFEERGLFGSLNRKNCCVPETGLLGADSVETVRMVGPLGVDEINHSIVEGVRLHRLPHGT